MKSTNSKKIFFIAVLFVLGFLSMQIFAQEKESLESKLKSIKGKIDKITLTAEGKEFIFEGEDAQKLGQSLKMFSKAPRLVRIAEDENFEHDPGNVMIYKMKHGNGDWKIKSGDEKKVEVKIEDGNKKVTVTTNKDGKEEVKVYEGEEAEKFLQAEEENGNVMIFKVGEGEDFEWHDKDGDRKKVEVKIEDGVKKVAVKTTKDGKEEVKVYEGEEAEKYLQENNSVKKFEFFMDDDENGDIIIIKKRTDDDCREKHFKVLRDKDVKKIIIEKKEKDEDQKKSE